jgi:methylmalonyl-CoA mutase
MEASILEKTGFAGKSMTDWHAMAQKALKGADFDATLKSRTDDGLMIEPLYAGKTDACLLPRQNPDHCWTISQRLDDPDLQRCLSQGKTELENGATGLSLVLDTSPSAYGTGLSASNPDLLTRVLALSDSHNAVLRLEAGSLDAVDRMLHTATAFPGLKSHYGLDPIFLTGPDTTETYRKISNQAMASRNASTAFKADGRPVHNAGATEAQELAVIAASIAENFRLLDTIVDPASIIAATGICLSADQDQFITIAKVRAARLIVAKMLAACDTNLDRPVHIMAETSWRMLTLKDPETNILRNTIAAFSAGIGGADEISVLPHTLTLGLPDAAARRLARNTQIILASECHLDHVIDPASGSGGLENLTEDLAAKAWEIFRMIEREGGLLAALKAGLLQKLIKTAAAQRALRPIVGTSIFPAKAERKFHTLAPLRPVHLAHLQDLDLHRLDENPGYNLSAESAAS